MIETRVREYLRTKAESGPLPDDRLSYVMQRGRRRRLWRRTSAGVGVAAALVLVTVGSSWVFSNPAVAVSPMTGDELAIIGTEPAVVMQGELGPAPETTPPGVDLTFVPIEEPTPNDRAAIEETIRHNRYNDPAIVALGRIEAFDTNVYVIHELEPEFRTGESAIVAVGPDYPSFESMAGPTEQALWGPAGSRGPDGGWVAMRIPEFASWQYMQVHVGGEVSWQRPSDGFVWIPYSAQPNDTVTVTGHALDTGAAHLGYIVDPPVDEEELHQLIDALQSQLEALSEQRSELEQAMTTVPDESRGELEDQIESISRAQRRLAIQVAELSTRIPDR